VKIKYIVFWTVVKNYTAWANAILDLIIKDGQSDA
jgi:hypothetical protein